MKEIKVEWCKNWIIAKFEKHPFPNGGFEVNCFWDMAEKAGLWIRGAYGSPMSIALSELTNVETVKDSDGNYMYTVFKRKPTKA